MIRKREIGNETGLPVRDFDRPFDKPFDKIRQAQDRLNQRMGSAGKESDMRDTDQNELTMRTICIGLAIGMPIGLVLSAIFLFVLDAAGLVGVGAAIGMSLSIAIGEGLYQRKMRS